MLPLHFIQGQHDTKEAVILTPYLIRGKNLIREHS